MKPLKKRLTLAVFVTLVACLLISSAYAIVYYSTADAVGTSQTTGILEYISVPQYCNITVDFTHATLNATYAGSVEFYFGHWNTSTCAHEGMHLGLAYGSQYRYMGYWTNVTGTVVKTEIAEGTCAGYNCDNFTLVRNDNLWTLYIDNVLEAEYENADMGSIDSINYMQIWSLTYTATNKWLTAGNVQISVKADIAGTLSGFLPILIVFVVIGSLTGLAAYKRR